VATKKVGRGRTYRAYSVYLPSTLVSDSAFPFKPQQKLVVRIKGRGLWVERVERKGKRA